MVNNIYLLVGIFAVSSSVALGQVTVKRLDFDTPGVLPSSDPDVSYSTTWSIPETSVFSVTGGVLNQDTTGLTGNASYVSYLNQLDTTLSLSLETEIDFLSISGSAGAYFQAFDGSFRYSMFFTDSGVGVATSSGNQTFPLTTIGQHVYRLESVANSSETSLFYDGNFVGTWNAAPYTGLNGWGFGDGSSPSGNWAQAGWNYVEVQQNITLSPVPEPATVSFALITTSLCLLALRRRRRSK